MLSRKADAETIPRTLRRPVLIRSAHHDVSLQLRDLATLGGVTTAVPAFRPRRRQRGWPPPTQTLQRD
jgi:hypothetical protein